MLLESAGVLILSYRFPGSRGPPSATSVMSPPPSRAPSTISNGWGSRAHSARGSAGQPAKPPGLALQYERYDWADEVDRYEAEQGDEPTTPSASNASFNLGPDEYSAPRRYVPDPEGPIDPDQDYEYEDEDRPKRSTAQAMKDFSNGLDDEPTQDWTRADWEAVYDRDHDPWNGYAAPKWEPPTKINRIKEKDSEGRKDIEVWKCPQHGPTCNPGICKERARVERDRRWEEERKKREDDKKKRQEERERNRLKKERKLARAEGREPEVTYDPPPHFGNRQRWGSNDSNSDSSSTSNDSDRDGSRNQGALLITTERTKN